MFADNRICKLVKIEYPIFQGAMAWISEAHLAAAVSNAGGLGIIAASSTPIEKVEQELVEVKKLTTKPFGINIMLKSPTINDIIALIKQYHVPVVTCGAGKPSMVIDKLKGTGTLVIPVISSVKHATAAVAAGADALIAEGCESGGHVGHTTTLTLLPEVVDNVDVPVIGAGGIIEGRGMVAAFALGAEGVQMGTRFICAAETCINPYYQQIVLEAVDNPTTVTGRSIRHPIRAIKNDLVLKLERVEQQDTANRTNNTLSLIKGKLQLAVTTGDRTEGHYQCGEGCGLVHRVELAREIINATVREFQDTISKLERI